MACVILDALAVWAYRALMPWRFIIPVALVAMLAGCNGRNGNGSSETRPRANTTHPRSTGMVAIGSPGDRWLDSMQYQIVARSSRNGEYGYEVTYEVPGVTKLTLFWSRDQIDFRGALPETRLETMPLGDGLLHYPETITRESLPDVYQAIQLIENGHVRDANGMLTAAKAFALVASLGMAKPALRAPAPSAPAPRTPVSSGPKPAPAGAPTAAQAARGLHVVNKPVMGLRTVQARLAFRGPPSSLLRGGDVARGSHAGSARAFVTDHQGRIIREITRDRVKVRITRTNPDGQVFEQFRKVGPPTAEDLQLLRLVE